jgi:hypothetical protein
MGNPHAVALVENLDGIDIKEIGPKIENSPLFPSKINVEFVEKIRDDYFKVKFGSVVVAKLLLVELVHVLYSLFCIKFLLGKTWKPKK